MMNGWVDQGQLILCSDLSDAEVFEVIDSHMPGAEQVKEPSEIIA
jgi:hypothetical protein